VRAATGHDLQPVIDETITTLRLKTQSDARTTLVDYYSQITSLPLAKGCFGAC
jgi:hypothetical protein